MFTIFLFVYLQLLIKLLEVLEKKKYKNTFFLKRDMVITGIKIK